jgi:hypothetical protein
MDQRPDIWTAEGVKGGLIRFYHEIAGVGLVFPLASAPIAVSRFDLLMGPRSGPGSFLARTILGWPASHPNLHPIEGLEYVEETVAALGYSGELAHHLFRECWAEGTGSDTDLCLVFGWEVEDHKLMVATAAHLVALWHNGRITVDGEAEAVSGDRHLIRQRVGT